MKYIIMVIALGGVVWYAGADSLFTKAAADNGTLISDKRVRFKKGDLITVLVKENIDAETDSDTHTKKQSDLQTQAPLSANSFLTSNNGLNILRPGELPNWQINTANELKGNGTTDRKNILTTTVSCIVTDVLDNGNVQITGTKEVTVNREDSTILVSGVVRPRDVTPQNTILSSQIANAVIQLKGKGPLWNNQRRGWFTKLVDWLAPY